MTITEQKEDAEFFNLLESANCFNLNCLIKIEWFEVTHCAYTNDESNKQVLEHCDIKIKATASNLLGNFGLWINYFSKSKASCELLERFLQPGTLCIAKGTLSVLPEESECLLLYGPSFYPIEDEFKASAKRFFEQNNTLIATD